MYNIAAANLNLVTPASHYCLGKSHHRSASRRRRSDGDRIGQQRFDKRAVGTGVHIDRNQRGVDDGRHIWSCRPGFQLQQRESVRIAVRAGRDNPVVGAWRRVREYARHVHGIAARRRRLGRAPKSSRPSASVDDVLNALATTGTPILDPGKRHYQAPHQCCRPRAAALVPALLLCRHTGAGHRRRPGSRPPSSQSTRKRVVRGPR